MILVAVGTQLPFDRLTKAVDAWCVETGRGGEVFGQIGRIGPKNYTPRKFQWAKMVDAETFREKMMSADVVVSHAGMGSIITAMSLAKPVVVLPRRAHLGEHRNDHQFATVKRLGSRPGIYPVKTETELAGQLDQLLGGGQAQGPEVSNFAQDRLIKALRGFIVGSDLS